MSGQIHRALMFPLTINSIKMVTFEHNGKSLAFDANELIQGF